MATMQALARRLGRDHDLAAALWDTDWYEARILAAFVEEPAAITSAQMNRWCRSFDNWAICDTMCLHLFDRTPHAWSKVRSWSGGRAEFVRRAGFALLAALALHDKRASDVQFLRALPLVETAASDDRNFVKKAVNWALRAIGRRNVALHTAAMDLAHRLSASDSRSARWVGKDAVRQLNRSLVLRHLHRASSP
jgi:3-methyladenine DNA glycosylase AlkD